MASPELYWLPQPVDFAARMRQLDALTDPQRVWAELTALAATRLDFIRTDRVDRSLKSHFSSAPSTGLATRPIKLAVLGSSTLGHLLPSLRIAALRRDIWLSTHEGEYGQYLHELMNPTSSLHGFLPDAVLFAFDAPHLLRGASLNISKVEAKRLVSDVITLIRNCWQRARGAFGCHVIQQTLVPVFPTLLGNNEHRLPGSRAALVSSVNYALREAADVEGVDLVAIDNRVAIEGLAHWHEPALWLRAKQEISPSAAPMLGDLVGRLIAARQGRSRKCLVLDLDNTLWGGVIGDAGIEGITLGQGSALGEAFVAVQAYALELSKRGVILAVCSKNDEANALAPFEKHPEMVLKRSDIACFVANWKNKADNLRSIAKLLNIGLDSLVFLDDNPFERNLVRTELPMVAVPEVTDDPAMYPACIADAGYFEALTVTDEDLSRTEQYRANEARELLASEATDMGAYLRQLEMRLAVRHFDRIGLQRIVQLINKTNQFNLTTRRYTEEEVQALMADLHSVGLQFRLIDRFGDNGIIAIVIVQMDSGGDALIDSWLMSCRVLGRGVEQATLDAVVKAAKKLGARRLIGVYRPTAKNGIVREHYQKLGFALLSEDTDGTITHWLELGSYRSMESFITIEESENS